MLASRVSRYDQSAWIDDQWRSSKRSTGVRLY